MPRGKYYPEEIREEARRLRREGWSLNEIAAKLGPPKNTLTLWVRGITLTREQRMRLLDKEAEVIGRNRALAAATNRQARIGRINAEKLNAYAFLDTLDDQHKANHIAAAMLYLAEGAKAEGKFAFGNSNPQVIRYWLYLLRTSFSVDESKFRIQLMTRADQDLEQLRNYWSEVTGIDNFMVGHVDARTEGKPTRRADYMGVCQISYFDVSIRRYLDALAAGMMSRALGDEVVE